MKDIKFNVGTVLTNPQGDAGWPISLLNKRHKAIQALGDRHLLAQPATRRQIQAMPDSPSGLRKRVAG
jgi:hypothetical protein